MSARLGSAHPGTLVRIEAEPIDGRRCRFLIDRPIEPDRWAYFGSPAAAAGSPLAERLFALPGVEGLLISHDKVIVTRTSSGGLPVVGPAVGWLRRALGDRKAGAETWPRLARLVGRAIREHLASGAPAISEAAHASMPSPAQLRARVEAVLNAEVNPLIASHGGGVRVLNLIDNVVYLEMWGGCQGCGLADVTLSVGVAATIREAVPEIVEIFDLTNHRAGVRPYHAGGSPAVRSPFTGPGSKRS